MMDVVYFSVLQMAEMVFAFGKENMTAAFIHGSDILLYYFKTRYNIAFIKTEMSKKLSASLVFLEIDFALFRYFGKCCSDNIDIVPLKRYTIS